MNKERIEFLEKQIENLDEYRKFAGFYDYNFLTSWLEDLKADEWHDINDGMPCEELKDYLVTLSDGTITVNNLVYEDDCFFFVDNYRNLEDVIAWKELPKPYIKGSDE